MKTKMTNYILGKFANCLKEKKMICIMKTCIHKAPQNAQIYTQFKSYKDLIQSLNRPRNRIVSLKMFLLVCFTFLLTFFFPLQL